MRIGLIGLGMMGKRHLDSLRALGYEVSIVMGHSKEKAEDFAKENRVEKWTDSLDELFAANLDVLHVCTPPLNHYEVVKRALERGIHIICEKPFVFSEEEGEELVRLAKEKGVVNAIDFNVRYHAAPLACYSMVQNKEFGDVLLLSGSYMQEFHALPSFFSWRYQEESAGKFLATTEIGSHWIDLLRFLSNKEILAVSATFGNFFPDRTIKDGMQYPKDSVEGTPFRSESDNVALVSFRLTDGTLAEVVLSEITPGRQNYLEIQLTGSKGSFWWNAEDLNRFHVGTKGEPVKENVLAFGDGFNQSVTNLLRDVYIDIENGKISENKKYADFEDGLINTKVCNAIYKSAKNNSIWVEVV